MKLTDLFPVFTELATFQTVDVKGLSADSREVKSDFLFAALPGTQVDGKQFVDQAIAFGASVILQLSDTFFIEEKNHIIFIHFADVQALTKHLGEAASKFYHEPSKQVKVIGVTGTNGKTSVCHLLAQSLQALGHKAAVQGTAGNGIWPDLHPATHTTLGVVELHRQLADYVAQGVEYVAMEVSSHGLSQGRVEGVNFETVAFTNLTRDHLDYHQTAEAYAQAKRHLFDLPHQYAVLNADDAQTKTWLPGLKQEQTVLVSCHADQHAQVKASGVALSASGINANIATSQGTLTLSARLLGEFNLSNLLIVVAILLQLDVKPAAIEKILPNLHPVWGRMQVFRGDQMPVAVVDYAHTPDALEKALLTLKPLCKGQLICIFGCGGERDRGKRPLMGEIAEKYADKVLISNDNPRHENPESIVRDILSGMRNPQDAMICYDRDQAIRDMIQQASEQDIILVAGKGHEDYQWIGDERKTQSDILTVKEALGVI